MMALASRRDNLAQPHTLVACEQPVEDFLLDNGGKNGDVLGIVEQINQPLESVKQRGRPSGKAPDWKWVLQTALHLQSIGQYFL